MSDWVWVINPINNMPHRLPNNPSVIKFHELRGYEVTELPGELSSDDPEFVELLEQLQAEESAEEQEPVEAEQPAVEKEGSE